MYASIERSQLVGALKFLAAAVPVTAQAAAVPAFGQTHLKVDGPTATFSATDGIVAARTKIPCDQEVNESVGGEVCVGAEKFRGVVGVMGSKHVTLALKDNSVGVFGGSAEFGMPHDPANLYPSLPFDGDTGAQATLEFQGFELLGAIRALSFIPPQKEIDQKYILSGVFFDCPDPSTGLTYLVASDGHRMGHYPCPAKVVSEKPVAFLAPLRLVRAMAQLEAEDGFVIKFRVGENHVIAEVGDSLISCKRLASGFPAYQGVLKVLAAETVTPARFESEPFLAVVSRACTTGSYDLSLKLTKDSMAVSARGADSWFAEEIETTTEGATAFEFLCGAHSVLEIAKAIAKRAATVRISQDPRGFIFVRSDSDGLIYAIAPVVRREVPAESAEKAA